MAMKRRQHFVDSHVQGSLLRRILVHWLVFFGVACLSVVALQSLLGNPGVPMMERVQSEMGEFVFLGIVLLSLFPAFMLDTIRFSNRFVGPIARLRRSLRELGEDGKTPTLQFREADFWADVAQEFNTINQRVQQQTDRIAELEKQLADKQPVS